LGLLDNPDVKVLHVVEGDIELGRKPRLAADEFELSADAVISIHNHYQTIKKKRG